MKRLSFVLPDFTRLAWVNDEERELWEPRINRIKKAWKDVELESVRAGLRPCSLVHLSAADLPREAGRWASKGLALLPVSVDGVSKYGYASSTVPYQPGKPFSHRVVLGTPQNVETFKKRWNANDNAGIGELLGYPECCRDFFQRVYVKDRLVDVTWSMAIRTVGTEPDSRCIELTAPIGGNILWRWMGVRMVPHLPCSFNCDRTIKFADLFQNLAVESGYGDEAGWTREILSWSVEWSALHGIAEIKTPLLKVTTRTDSTAQKYVVRLRGTAKLKGGVEGLTFPNLGMVKNLEPPWFNFDNGFSSRQLMAASHAPIVELVTSLYEGRSASVLDLGCGNAALLATIREKNHRITPYGIDFNRGRIEHASLVLPEFRENFVAGDLFEQTAVWSEDRRYDLALLMLGRLTETDAEHVIFLKRQVERYCDKLLVYAYGDWIRRYDGLEGLAKRVGVHLLSNRPSQGVSLAEFGTEADIRLAKVGYDSRRTL